MQGLSTNNLLLGSGILSVTGTSLYVNGSLASSQGGSTNLNIIRELYPEDAQFMTGNFPLISLKTGNVFPISSLSYRRAVNERAYWKFNTPYYTGSSLNVDIYWSATGVTTNNVVFGASVAAITSNTDSQDIETKAFGVISTGYDTHLGTTARRLHNFSINISDINSLTQGDVGFVEIVRSGTLTDDTIASDIFLERAVLRN